MKRRQKLFRWLIKQVNLLQWCAWNSEYHLLATANFQICEEWWFYWLVSRNCQKRNNVIEKCYVMGKMSSYTYDCFGFRLDKGAHNSLRAEDQEYFYIWQNSYCIYANTRCYFRCIQFVQLQHNDKLEKPKSIKLSKLMRWNDTKLF